VLGKPASRLRRNIALPVTERSMLNARDKSSFKFPNTLGSRSNTGSILLKEETFSNSSLGNKGRTHSLTASGIAFVTSSTHAFPKSFAASCTKPRAESLIVANGSPKISHMLSVLLVFCGQYYFEVEKTSPTHPYIKRVVHIFPQTSSVLA